MILGETRRPSLTYLPNFLSRLLPWIISPSQVALLSKGTLDRPSCLSLSNEFLSPASTWHYAHKPATSLRRTQGSPQPLDATKPASPRPCWFPLFLRATSVWSCLWCPPPEVVFVINKLLRSHLPSVRCCAFSKQVSKWKQRVGRSGAGILLPWQKLRGRTWGQDGAVSILPALQSHLGHFQCSRTPVCRDSGLISSDGALVLWALKLPR